MLLSPHPDGALLLLVVHCHSVAPRSDFDARRRLLGGADVAQLVQQSREQREQPRQPFDVVDNASDRHSRAVLLPAVTEDPPEEDPLARQSSGQGLRPKKRWNVS